MLDRTLSSSCCLHESLHWNSTRAWSCCWQLHFGSLFWSYIHSYSRQIHFFKTLVIFPHLLSLRSNVFVASGSTLLAWFLEQNDALFVRTRRIMAHLLSQWPKIELGWSSSASLRCLGFEHFVQSRAKRRCVSKRSVGGFGGSSNRPMRRICSCFFKSQAHHIVKKYEETVKDGSPGLAWTEVDLQSRGLMLDNFNRDGECWNLPSPELRSLVFQYYYSISCVLPPQLCKAQSFNLG